MTEDDSRNRIVAVISRTPFTIAFTLALLVIAAATGTLFTPASQQPWYPQVATGIPSFADGRWWTVFTSAFFVDHPLVLITLLPLVLGGLGWAE